MIVLYQISRHALKEKIQDNYIIGNKFYQEKSEVIIEKHNRLSIT